MLMDKAREASSLKTYTSAPGRVLQRLALAMALVVPAVALVALALALVVPAHRDGTDQVCYLCIPSSSY